MPLAWSAIEISWLADRKTRDRKTHSRRGRSKRARIAHTFGTAGRGRSPGDV